MLLKHSPTQLKQSLFSLIKALYDLPDRDEISKDPIASDGNFAKYSEDIDAITEKGIEYREEKKRKAMDAKV